MRKERKGNEIYVSENGRNKLWHRVKKNTEKKRCHPEMVLEKKT